MAKEISDRSREFSQKALATLEAILEKYPQCPDAHSMREEDRSWLRNKMIEFGNAIGGTRYKGFTFFDKTKEIRNNLAHATEERIADTDYFFKTFFNFSQRAKNELEKSINNTYSKNKEIRFYEKLGDAFGSEKLRKGFVDSLPSQILDEKKENLLPLKFETKTQEKIAEAATSVLKSKNENERKLLNFTKNTPSLLEPVQKELIQFTENLERKISKENPFVAEEYFIQKLKNLYEQKQNFPQINELQKEYENLKSVQQYKSFVAFDFYQKQFDELEQSKKDFQNKNDILVRNLIADMEKNLTERKYAWELTEIENARREFLKKLYEKIEKYKKLFELFKSVSQDCGNLWDLAESEFNDHGFEIIEKYADLLEADKGLQELAEAIGRHYSEEKKYRKELRKKIIATTHFTPKPAYRGQISGLKLSDEIKSALPSELALYANPKTKAIFKMKFAQKQLLSYAYVRDISYQKFHEETEEVEVGETQIQKGPMIICVDTSGSMHGTPERIAKTITFALAKKSLEEKRACFLISFSTQIETLDLSSFQSAQGLNNLVKFLRMSFQGGTDATPALKYAVHLLQQNSWETADVLMISDFIMNGINSDLAEDINALKEKECRFFSLAITNSGNNSVISAFNKNWIYDTSSRNASANLVRQLAEIK